MNYTYLLRIEWESFLDMIQTIPCVYQAATDFLFSLSLSLSLSQCCI